MKKLSSHEIRERFLKFFEDKDHLRIGGSSLIPKGDPTLLFINSGMAPLKRYFLGKAQPPKPRLANVQPCIRTKDIDDVGDRHHLTLFEMLGSWSIGDYYKEGAVSLAYELLVDRLGFDKNRLWVTVYGGDPKQNLPPDEESAKYWEKAGIARDHILSLGQDNFWGPAGETGPCGPCTEVFFDCGEKFGPAYKHGDEWVTTGRYIEIWNAGVFMQYNKLGPGKFEPLPLKSVDTGSGLERMAMVMNDVESAYETDLLSSVLKAAQERFAGPGMGIREFRILADHVKASTFILSEGVFPSNEGQGYIPRRLIRKCIALAVKAKAKTDLIPLVEETIRTMGPYYDHLGKNRDATIQKFQTEVREFEPIIRKGIELLDVETVRLSKGATLPAKLTFDLVTSHGVPLEIVRAHAADRGLKIDDQGYEKHFEEHQEISRQGRKSVGASGAAPKLELAAKGASTTDFRGYEEMSSEGKIVRLTVGENAPETVAGGGTEFLLVTDRTPFYGESGGQVGDVGTAKTETGEAQILDTQKADDVHVHLAKLVKGTIKAGQKVRLDVDKERRLLIRRNHTATHLLHSALRAVLGPHVQQKGSMVDVERTRFDFQHPQALTPEEIEKVEAWVNAAIWRASPRDARVMSYDQGIETGAIALFGENYGDQVRVLKFGNDSTEFCGGTHVENTAEIGMFVVTSEGSVAKGVRRIEGVTGQNALNQFNERRRLVRELGLALGVPPAQIVERVAQLKKAGGGKKAEAAPTGSLRDEKTIDLGGGLTLFMGRLDASGDAMKDLAEQKLNQKAGQVVLLAGGDGESARVVVMADVKAAPKANSGKIIGELLKHVDGRGGGKPNYAQGGGKNVAGLGALFQAAPETVKSLLS
ncbi:MAG: alanine--tRNA ligase [Bdellovibrionales bacterium]|nr:alanine--tRNA ligase [Bdellovibrionales bacterium]